jgi:acetyl-CoA synthetase
MADRWIWQPTREWVENTNVYRFMNRLGFRTADDFLRFSHESLEQFWDEMVREAGIEWFQPYEKVLDDSRGVEWSRWFVNGRLNIAWNCLDRHARGPRANAPAILWEGEDSSTRSVAYAELFDEVNHLANGLSALGLKKGATKMAKRTKNKNTN